MPKAVPDINNRADGSVGAPRVNELALVFLEGGEGGGVEFGGGGGDD